MNHTVLVFFFLLREPHLHTKLLGASQGQHNHVPAVTKQKNIKRHFVDDEGLITLPDNFHIHKRYHGQQTVTWTSVVMNMKKVQRSALTANKTLPSAVFLTCYLANRLCSMSSVIVTSTRGSFAFVFNHIHKGFSFACKPTIMSVLCTAFSFVQVQCHSSSLT